MNFDQYFNEQAAISGISREDKMFSPHQNKAFHSEKQEGRLKDRPSLLNSSEHF